VTPSYSAGASRSGGLTPEALFFPLADPVSRSGVPRGAGMAEGMKL